MNPNCATALERTEYHRQRRIDRYRRAPGYASSSFHLLLHAEQGRDTFYDLDNLLSTPDAVQDVANQYRSVIERHREETRPSYLAFLEKPFGPVGTIVLAGHISIETGLPYILIRPRKEIVAEQVKLPSVTDTPASLEGALGVLLVDHATMGDEIIQCVEIVKQRGGRIGLAVAFSAYTDDVEAHAGEYLRANGVKFEAIRKCPQVDLKIQSE